jgi:pyruvate/2-oxoglutarate dehydrogenase complex dihydrolipoamide dehydrogenase (E3) component
VNGERLTSQRIFINVGGRALVPAFPGIAQTPFLTNSGMMKIDTLPPHLIVVGGSYVGLEFAQMFRRFGSQVTVVERNARLVAREDADISDALRQVLESEGIEVRTGADCIQTHPAPEGVRVSVNCEVGEPEVHGSHVLLAVGRMPNTDDLHLERAGVRTDLHGYILVDDECRTNVAGIWAMGECNGRGAFTHTAYNDYEIVAANLLDDDHRRISDRISCYALFTDPPLGRVGMSEAEVLHSGREALVGTRLMSNVKRAVERGETQGLMKVIVAADTHEILGAAILGLNGDEVVHGILDIMYARAPYTTLARAVHIHPTVSELIPTLLQDLHPLRPPAAHDASPA